MKNKPTIERTDIGCYNLDYIYYNATYKITHLKGQEPKIEIEDENY